MIDVNEVERHLGEQVGGFRSDISQILLIHSNNKDRYRRIHCETIAGVTTLVYLSIRSNRLVKIIIDISKHGILPPVTVFAEDPNVTHDMTVNYRFVAITELVGQIREHALKMKMLGRLKYGG